MFDNNPQALERLKQKGARVAASAQAMADEVEFVLLCLPMPSIVQSVVQGPAGVMHGKAVKVIVDLSTTGPSVTDSVAAAAAAKQIQWVGAPVSGGTTGAEKGTLTLMASGPTEAFERVKPFLSVLGTNIFYLGDRRLFFCYVEK